MRVSRIVPLALLGVMFVVYTVSVASYSASSGLGEAVPDIQAADYRGGDCTYSSWSCGTVVDSCSVETAYNDGGDSAGSARGSGHYCGSGSSCTEVHWYVQICGP